MLFEGAKVFDDAVVHERDDVIAADVWMGVLVRGRAVRSPTRVAKAHRAVNWRLFQFGREVVDASGRFGDGKLAGVERHDATAIVAAVFQPPQAFNQELECLLISYVAHNATHGSNPSPSKKRLIRWTAIRRPVRPPPTWAARMQFYDGGPRAPTVRIYGYLTYRNLSNFRMNCRLKSCGSEFPGRLGFADKSGVGDACPIPSKGTHSMSGHISASATPRSYVVIPARYGSTRLPRKMLLRETGKTLLQHTYEAACAANRPTGVLVATDHAEIAAEVERFRGDFVMTSPDCASGTDRVAEVARKLPRAEIVVNVQGDEPEMSPESIDRVIELLEQNSAAGMATLATPISSPEQLADPACVKAVFDSSGRAMYFSRSPIPFVREPSPTQKFNEPPLFYQHLGIYAYRRDVLLEVATMPPSSLELAERLEQLRMLQSGGTILVGVVAHAAGGIDTPADYAAFVARRRAG